MERKSIIAKDEVMQRDFDSHWLEYKESFKCLLCSFIKIESVVVIIERIISWLISNIIVLCTAFKQNSLFWRPLS
jgi:hypothetical protein